jgi:hypothetical protein
VSYPATRRLGGAACSTEQFAVHDSRTCCFCDGSWPPTLLQPITKGTSRINKVGGVYVVVCTALVVMSHTL